MDYDLDYEIYKYINEQAEQYVPFRKLLKNNNLTFSEARQKAQDFKANFDNLLSEYHIGNNNLVRICCDLMEKINENPNNSDLQYIYIFIMTYSGFLNEIKSPEQQIRNYINQNERIQELSDFLKSQIKNRDKLYKIQKHLKNALHIRNISCSEESDLLYKITLQYYFLYGSSNNKIYRDNLESLLIHINSDDILKSVKPYIIFAVLSRKHGMIQNRADFIPNFQTLFQYQTYNIMTDNGKNFNNYQSYTELYENLRRFYADDKEIDIELSDFCFSNLCSLSEWYYIWCEPNEEIPMNFIRKVYSLKSISFPMICDDYGDSDISEFETEHSEIYEIWEKTINTDMAEELLNMLCNSTDISKLAEKLPYGKEYPLYAEIFLYQSAEILLEEKMLRTAEKFIEI
ncbi:MAG: hypothetical protein ACI4K5_04350 [Ruminococcus sp.]